MSSEREKEKYASRAGEKLHAAIEQWVSDPVTTIEGTVCADLGANVGGFTDCLLKSGASKVFSVDTGYGVLDWLLRNDERVVVMERTNAMHVTLPELVDLVTIDTGWTKQHHIVPKAWELLKPGGWIFSLLKPQYEASPKQRRGGKLKTEMVDEVVSATCEGLRRLDLPIYGIIPSPLVGKAAGNPEFLLLIGPKATGGDLA